MQKIAARNFHFEALFTSSVESVFSGAQSSVNALSTQSKSSDCFHIVDTVEETCHRDRSI
jgi:hypothetical protein